MTLASALDRPALPHTAAEAVPLTEAQEGLWYAQRLDPLNPIFWTAQRVTIAGHLDLDAFRDAVAQAMREADGVLVRIVATDDGPRLHRDADREIVLEIVDLRGTDDPDAAAQAWMTLDAAIPRDPAIDPLARQVLFRLADDRHCWYQGIHHLVIDGYGTALLTARIAALYRAALTGDNPGPALVSFGDAVRDDQAYRISEKRITDRTHWLETLRDAGEVTGLAAGLPVTRHRALRTEAALDDEAIASLRALAAEAKVTWPDLLVTLIAAWVGRHTGESEVMLGVPTMNRFGTPLARVAAMTMNVLPVRIALDETVSPGAQAVITAGILRRARRHGRYRSEQLRRDLGRLGDRRRLHGIMVNILPFDEPLLLPDAVTQVEALGTGPVDDLTIAVRADATGGGMRFEIEANPGLYDEDTLRRHTAELVSFVSRAASAATLSDVATLDDAAAREWLTAVNATDHPVPDTTLTALLDQAMHEHAGALALTGDEGSLTYAELDTRTAVLAAALRARGVGPDIVVAVTIPRSLDLVVALVAILRAGGAYLPLDPEHPAPRRARMLAIAEPVLHLVRMADAIDDESNVPHLAVDALPESPAVADDTPLAQPGDLAYVIFTSGSTGEPKGVMIEHRAIVNRLEWMRVTFGVDATTRILQKTPATFDVSVWEFFLPLIAGGTLVVAPPGAHRDPAELVRIIRDHNVTMAHFVPSMLAVFLDEPGLTDLPLRQLFCSGEALSTALRDRCHQRFDVALHNLYGPTEAAVDVTWWDASISDVSRPMPIGRPVWNTRTYVLDKFHRPVPPGVTGDLHLAGVQLARGYLGRDDLTAARFIPDPLVPGERMYATGDRAAWRADGAILYQGRDDHQVKLRGIRIEPGEIEAALLAVPDVAHCAVIPREDRVGDPRLVAYVVAADHTTLDAAALRHALARSLPEAMIPSAFVMLPVLPVTANGKLDRAALPAPEARSTDVPGRVLTTAESRIAGLFAEVLGTIDARRVGADDDFFMLGGHSLLAARLVTRLREAYGREIGLGAIFAHPTVARLAEHLASHGEAAQPLAGLDPVILLAGNPASETAPLYCVHPAGGIAWCYGALGRALGDRAVYGLQSRGLAPDDVLPASLDELAHEYVERIVARTGHAPVHLAGWSVGGIIAQAMAVRLRALGVPVGVVALLDAYPSDRWHLAEEPTETSMLRALLLMAGQNPDDVDAATDRDGVVRLLRDRGHPLGQLSDEALHGVMRVVAHNNRLVRCHHHARYDGAVLHIAAADDHAGTTINADEWTPYVGTLIRHDLATTHVGIASGAMAPRLATLLRKAFTT